MRKLSNWAGGSRSGSRSAGLPSRRNLQYQPLRMIPDPSNRLADGILVEAQIRARLLGAPILRLDAVVVLSPARAATTNDTDKSAWPDSTRPDSTKLIDPPAAPALPRPRPGTRLADAITLVEQSAGTLRHSNRSRRNTRR